MDRRVGGRCVGDDHGATQRAQVPPIKLRHNACDFDLYLAPVNFSWPDNLFGEFLMLLCRVTLVVTGQAICHRGIRGELLIRLVSADLNFDPLGFPWGSVFRIRRQSGSAARRCLWRI